MKTKLAAAALLWLTALFGHSAPLPESVVYKIVNAIYVAEGGSKAKVPFGILSVRVATYAEARRVCENTVRNNWKRYGGSSVQEFITFLGKRYCPPAADPVGHRNWVQNVRRLYEKI